MTARFRPLVLCYHAVTERWAHALAVPPEALERQVERLVRRGYRPAPAGDVVDGRRRLLHVTFDDAFRSVARALPALERLGVPATVFVPTAFADRGAPLAIPELAPDAAMQPDELEVMGWDELRGLAERGVELGSHTASHPHLPELGDGELRRELAESRERLESELGRACRFLAYPFGEEDGRVRAAARAAGYDAAFALPGSEQPVDTYALPRVGIYRRDGRSRIRLKTTPLVRRTAIALRLGARV